MEQPVAIPYAGPDGHRRRYTPDYYLRHEGPYAATYLVEVKYRQDLFSDWKNLKPRLKAGRRHAREQGWRFLILTEKEIRGPALGNADFLARFRDWPTNVRHEEHLTHRLATIGPATPTKLLIAAYSSEQNRRECLGYLWKLIAIGRIKADLSQALNMDAEIWIDYDSEWAPCDPYSMHHNYVPWRPKKPTPPPATEKETPTS